MIHSIALATLLVVSALPAGAANTTGNSALSLAALVGARSPNLSRTEKTLLADYLNGKSQAPFSRPTVSVRADDVQCRISNVDITYTACALTFGTTTAQLLGSAAQAIYATLAAAGVPAEGAAGTLYEWVKTLDCTIEPAEVRKRDGEGARCTYRSM